MDALLPILIVIFGLLCLVVGAYVAYLAMSDARKDFYENGNDV